MVTACITWPDIILGALVATLIALRLLGWRMRND